jgi:hypothetical protein
LGHGGSPIHLAVRSGNIHPHGHLHFERITTITKQELDAAELAMTTILKGEYFKATQTEAEDFCNQWRIHMKIKTEPADEQRIIVTFPASITLPASKKAHGNTKLTEDDVRFVKTHPEWTAVALAKKFACSDATIHSIRQERTWSDVVVTDEPWTSPVDLPEAFTLFDHDLA